MTSSRSLFNLAIQRRAAALIAACCIVAAQAESLVPDAHERGSAAAQIGLGGTAEHAPAPTDAPVPHPGHSAHVDHCAHAHVFASTALSGPMPSLTLATGVPERPSPRLLSITAPPHRRPPIA